MVQTLFVKSPDLRTTRFHAGFQRRHQTDIRQDATRLQKEFLVQNNREARDRSVQTGWRNYQRDYTFNLTSGEGEGREFKSLGKRIVNPGGAVNSGIFAEHETDMRNRIVYI